MRVGMSPNRTRLTDYHPARVTICLLTYIPEQIGYYAQRFDVLKLCLHSIVKHTNSPYDLLVFDNGSCPEVVEYLRSLRDQGTIQYLILSSQNIGINGALKMMVNAAPGEVIAYSQDDVLFYPNWLQTHLEILDTFPRVGMVSGVAVRLQFSYGNRYLQTYLSDFPKIAVEYGRFIPDDWERDFFMSIGRDFDNGLDASRSDQDIVDASRSCQDIVLEYKGVKAYSTAVHFQYAARKAVMLQCLATPWDARLMKGPDIETDERIDSMGYARLSTFQRYVRHIGNVITPDLGKSVSALGLDERLKVWKPPTPFVVRFVRRGIFHKFLLRLHNWSYLLLRYGTLK
jgi:glycosyltransferase involved in cell wall biosynthesis